ncbi:phospholipase D-like domain-containing protein [Hymenobacter endophyticus]|uniref:phospholipase D n=1 Tax=Hymenobacter endophyticus TaxID=3076335 RepID=A0ABU3TDW6_9BACT|nr:phospholipase D-like domain-containing protein [Hymenobacter endophyticus]MDU0369571.1 phospholipase D-like domain-containing protein [Hymenobacter endophyticus]
MQSVAHFQSIKPAILAELKQAQNSIKIAVAWFTDQDLFAALIAQLQRRVAVSLLIRNDYVNNRPESLPWQQFIDAGGVLYFSPDAHALHHKFCLIDEHLLLSGSYNWTYMAEQRNQENCVFSTESALIRQFGQEFQRLISTLIPQTQPVRVAAPEAATEAYLMDYAATDQTLGRLPIYSESSNAAQPTSDELFEQGYQASLEMRYTAAIPFFQQALALNPTDCYAFQNLAICYLYLNKTDQAISTCQQAEKAGYGTSHIYNTLGQAYQLQGQTSLAVACFDKSIRLRPWSSLGLFEKWQSLYQARRGKEAEACRLELLTVTRDGIIKPHPKQDAVDLFYHHLNRATLFDDQANARKAAVAAQAVYDNLPESEKDQRLQKLLDELELLPKT